MWAALKENLSVRDAKSIARLISLIENEAEGYEQFLRELTIGSTTVVGITGAPGSGKSTLTDALIRAYVEEGKTVAVLCVDPSSPFNLGALLGDRIRMNAWYANPSVYIRSLASRGSLGGLSAKIMEVTDLLKASAFDLIIVETVGIGQSEVEVAGLADITILVLVPESGDEIQFMKAGVMEIADIFVINKCDRPGADILEKNLSMMLHERAGSTIPVIKTIASSGEGVQELKQQINALSSHRNRDKKLHLLADKAYKLIRERRMSDITKASLRDALEQEGEHFNLYEFIQPFI